MEELFSQLIEEIGEDKTREGLIDTPQARCGYFPFSQ